MAAALGIRNILEAEVLEATPEFIKLAKGTNGYNTDYNNLAPSISAAAIHFSAAINGPACRS